MESGLQSLKNFARCDTCIVFFLSTIHSPGLYGRIRFPSTVLGTGKSMNIIGKTENKIGEHSVERCTG